MASIMTTILSMKPLESTSLDVLGRFKSIDLQNEYILYCLQQRSKLSYAIITVTLLAWAVAESIASTWLVVGEQEQDRTAVEFYGIFSLILAVIGLTTCAILSLNLFGDDRDRQYFYSVAQVCFIICLNALFIIKSIKHIHLGFSACIPAQLDIEKLVTSSLPSGIPAAEMEMVENLLKSANLPPDCPSQSSFTSLVSYDMVLVMSFCPQLLMALIYEPRLYLLLGCHFPTAAIVCYAVYSAFYALLPVMIAFIIIAFIFGEIHYQRVKEFLNQKKVRQLLEDNEKNADATSAMEMRHMIGNVAHDLKTPLASFTTGLDLIKDILLSAQEKEKQLADSRFELFAECFASIHTCLQNIKNTNSFMLMTINRCIDYTKASKGMKLVPKHETVDLTEVLRFPIECMSHIQERIGITLEPLSPELCSHIITDKQWLQENLLCLLSNAVKYSTEGNVTITAGLIKRASLVPRDDSLFSRHQSSSAGMNPNNKIVPSNDNDDPEVESNILFEIEDNGIGLSEDAMKNLFNPFKQAQRLAGGTGLGLYSLAKRMDALKGSYGVRKRKDGKQGSLFWFAIPYRPDTGLSAASYDSFLLDISPRAKSLKMIRSGTPPSISQPSSTAITPLPSELELLIVDDAPSILKLSSMLLKRQGHKIWTAENGEIALKSIEEKWRTSGKGFDLVLMDLQMPVMDGLEATRRLRLLEEEGREWMVKRNNDNKNINNPESFSSPTLSLHQVVIGLSANSDHDTMNDAFAAGVDEFFGKPFSLDTFNKAITKLFC